LPKALVDSERIITRLRAEGYELARKHDGADIVIVNTCGFLDSAKQESLGAIGQAMAENGKVIVTGCMGAEPRADRGRLSRRAVDHGPQQYESVLDAVHRALPPVHNPHLDLVPPQGIKLTPRHYAYLKISEGCNNRCSFCIIPKLRGDLVSRRRAMCCARPKTGHRRRQGIAGHFAGHLGLRRRCQICREPVEGPRGPRAIFDLAKELGEFGAWCGCNMSTPTRMSTKSSV
jgi:ribosomal protein S12 methylthiotransferase